VLLDVAGDVELIGQSGQLVHGLGEIPLGGGVDSGPNVPLAQPHHLEAVFDGKRSPICVFIGLKGRGEAFIELLQGRGSAGAGLRPPLFGGKGTPLGFLVENLLLEHESTLITGYFTRLRVCNELLASALWTASVLEHPSS